MGISLPTVPPPRIAAALLAAVLAVQVVGTVSSVAPLLRPRPAVGTTAPQVRPAPAFTAATIVAAHLFGAALSARDETKDPPPVSSVPLVLAGTIALADPTQGQAIIGTIAQTARIYHVGSTVADGVILKKVYADHADIERGGQIETLRFPRSALLESLTPRVLAAGSAVAVTAPVEMPEMPSDIRSRFEYENQRVATAMTEVPLMSGETFRGLTLQPGADPALLAQMGFKPGDKVLGVNGINITDAQRIDLLRKAMLSGQPFRVDVVRVAGGQQTLELDASLFQGLVTN
jgi:type II secretion system protein C